MPDRPVPERKDKKSDGKGDLEKALEQAEREEAKQDFDADELDEIEGDVLLEKVGGENYAERLQLAIQNIRDNPETFLSKQALLNFSPKFLHILENIEDVENDGLHLVYSQFRTAEGIGLFSAVLEHNGFTRFNIKKTPQGEWLIDIPESGFGLNTYALYTGTETSEEKEIIRYIYNGEWDKIPDSIARELRRSHVNNNMGEVIKILMITSSGSEGINLRNTRFVHIMEPYWHPVRTEQVIGRARRICSHKDLPQSKQTVEVFLYLMTFSPEQLISDEAIELKRKDLSKALPRVPITSDEYLFEISEIKARLTGQLTDIIKESAFDCYIYNPSGKCVNFASVTNDKFSYTPSYVDQENDATVQANTQSTTWKGKLISIPIRGKKKEFVYREDDRNRDLLHLYDKKIYDAKLKNPSDEKIILREIGTFNTMDGKYTEIK
jgi:hypothetical protein